MARYDAYRFCAIFVLIRELNCAGGRISRDRLKFHFTVGVYAELLAIVRVMKVAYLFLRNRCSFLSNEP
jgi:hypothetical protein